MRLQSLRVVNWKNLDDFTVDFDRESFTAVFVGRNATAKSNLLEAIVVIFRDLDLGERPTFAYQLEYACRGSRVRIDADPGRRGQDSLRILVDGRSVGQQSFSRDGGGKYLPSNLFVYYSGFSDRMLSHFEKHEERFDKQLRAGRDEPLRPLLYVNLLHSKFALLSFFWRDDSEQKQFLKDYLRIVDLDSVLFVLRRPHWYNRNRLSGGDPRFWGAEGVVGDLLDRLYARCVAPLLLRGRKGRRRSFEHLYLFLPNKGALQEFGDSYSSGREFFKALDSLHLADLVEDVRARVVIEGVDDSLTFRELSEGEQQLLMVLGLLRFTREDESLILLDEPDTHLNPAWSLSYVHLINKSITHEHCSQVVMATHDPMVVAGLRAKEVYLMRRDRNGRVRVAHPEQDPIGMGTSNLLMSDVYGLRSDLDPQTLERLDTRRRLATKDDLSRNEQAELERLNQWVKEQGFTRVDRDPLYNRFVDAMTKWERSRGSQKQRLTQEELLDQRKVAEEIVSRLMADHDAE